MQKGFSSIPNGIGKCLTGCKWNAKPLNQIVKELPFARLKVNEPHFTHKGMDYCWLFTFKQDRSSGKRYSYVFSCLISRAVHIELAFFTTHGFLNVLHRFITGQKEVPSIYTLLTSPTSLGQRKFHKRNF